MALAKKSIRAFAYLRTSSAANIGEDKDSGRRQRHAIEAFAERAGIELAGMFHDEAVKGSDPHRYTPRVRGNDGGARGERHQDHHR